MISFRYHIVSIVSVFLALAVGIVLGGGPLKREVDNTLVTQVQQDRQAKADLRAQIATLRGSTAFDDAFAATVGPRLVRGRLTGRTVTVLVLPGSQQSRVASLEQLVRQAGGRIGGTVRVGRSLLDTGQKSLVDELASRLYDSLPAGTHLRVADDATGYQRMGALVARAVGTVRDRGAPVDAVTTSVLSGLAAANLVSTQGDLRRRGSLVLVLAGPGNGDSDQQQGADAVATTLVEQLDADTDGVVVAGPLASASGGGFVKALRDDVVASRDVSSVDVVGRTAGEVVAVLALAQQARGVTGQYGAVDPADGAMPGARTGG